MEMFPYIVGVMAWVVIPAYCLDLAIKIYDDEMES